jgi:hypothetical protein
MEMNPVIQQRSLGFPWDTIDPFLLCVHHDDAYPRGNAQIEQAFADYSRTRFGGWPWPDPAPVHGPERRRFATYADGHTQTKPAVFAD